MRNVINLDVALFLFFLDKGNNRLKEYFALIAYSNKVIFLKKL